MSRRPLRFRPEREVEHGLKVNVEEKPEGRAVALLQKRIWFRQRHGVTAAVMWKSPMGEWPGRMR